ncbi:hypothetical protein V8E54_004100 [Elaphomyces granulatus]
MPYTDPELGVFVVIERACSAVSIVGISIIISTFLISPLFRKPINRLVFYTSWGNLGSSVAMCIGRSGIGSRFCPFLAFLLQWFVASDALWTFCMACNVYLTFFHRYSDTQLKRIEWKYFLLCYGFSFFPAFILLFVRTDALGPVYGSAVLWCWITFPWDFLRIAVFYGPVWFVTILTFGIYIRAGREIYHTRNQLQSLSSIDDEHEVTEIRITSEAAGLRREDSQQRSQSAPYSPYSVIVEGGDMPESSAAPQRLLTASTDSNARRRSARAYFKYAILNFIALLVTLVPSTINRVYIIVRPEANNFGLELATCFVLPLQGFWNSIVYTAISWSSMKTLFRRGLRRDLSPAGSGR